MSFCVVHVFTNPSLILSPIVLVSCRLSDCLHAHSGLQHSWLLVLGDSWFACLQAWCTHIPRASLL